MSEPGKLAKALMAVMGGDRWARVLTSEDMDAVQLSIKSQAKAADLDMITINSELDGIAKRDIPLPRQPNLPRLKIDIGESYDTGWQDIVNSLGSEGRAWALLEEAVTRETTKTQADLEKLCRADSVSEARWFPTSVNDGEWLVVGSLVDSILDHTKKSFKKHPDMGPGFYTADILKVSCHNGEVLGIYQATFTDIYTPYGNLYGINDTGCRYTFENLQDFSATNGGEATGPPVINGFVAPFVEDKERFPKWTGLVKNEFDILVDDWEGSEVGQFDIEIEEAV